MTLPKGTKAIVLPAAAVRGARAGHAPTLRWPTARGMIAGTDLIDMDDVDIRGRAMA
ncbi:MAG: hypothetical protein U5M50_10010 [Sphingobium sp.]|nr:hypothetical protein [Sphingobium sp.]